VAEPFSQRVALPGAAVSVDTTTGAFATAETDLTVPGALPLVLTRYYHGHSDEVGTLGARWSHSYDISLALSADDDAIVRFGTGAEEHFDWRDTIHDPAGYYPADPRLTSTLVHNQDGTYTYTTRFGWIYCNCRFASGRGAGIKVLHRRRLATGLRLPIAAAGAPGWPLQVEDLPVVHQPVDQGRG
jgi:hypothetical protein